MSWFRSALAICMPEPGAYYSSIDLTEFYEWKFTKMAPKGSIFSKHLPPSDIFTTGKIIVSALVDDDKLDKTEQGYKLKSDAEVDISLKIGNISTPKELLDQHKQKKRSFNSGLDSFKKQLYTRIYSVSQAKVPVLYKITDATNTHVNMLGFGSIKDLIKNLDIARDKIQKLSLVKQPHARAIELEEFRRYENAMDFVNNSHLHVDASKMERLLMSAGIKPEHTRKISWINFYLEMSPGAQLLKDTIDKFSSFSWVKSSLN